MSFRRTTKLTYPLAHNNELLVPAYCRHSVEPCAIETQGCYGPYIQQSFELILQEIVDTGTTKSPHACLVQSDPDCKVWKIHWQRGGRCSAGPGHCITVFQNRPHGTVNWRVDFRTHTVYSVPFPRQNSDNV
uniref:NS7c protein n=1 Tax=Bird deltacoronavirus CalidrisCN24 TaxID=3237949 RepID=A0AB39AG89_9NIDO